MFPMRVAVRVLTKWTPGEGGCWISTYSVGSHGYAQVGWTAEGRNTMTTAHRVAWWAANLEPIPPGMTVDHVCHVKRCVNPTHLRLLPNEVNASDNGQVRTNEETGRSCHKGHPMVRMSTTGRTYCRECRAERKRLARRKF